MQVLRPWNTARQKYPELDAELKLRDSLAAKERPLSDDECDQLKKANENIAYYQELLGLK